ncbi:MAG TPA: hypothetical protein VG099_14060 [Gemmataceae bacterium]|nr:hypothetical protein [Gemmataceae bacterium]
MQEGIDLFAQRPDKEWSLTDCISFVVMNIFLFEVIGNNSDQTLNPERELFETTFSSSRGFDIGADQRLHLVLTNPREFKTALDEDWPSAREILAAIRWGDYKVLHADATGKRMLGMIRAKLGPRRKASRGCSAGLDKPKPIRLAGR